MNKDSGMSDSSFYNFQNKIQEKMKKFVADTDKEVKQQNLEQRFLSKVGKPKTTTWEKLKGWFK